MATYRIVARSRHDQAATVESLKEEPTAKREGEDEITEREVTSLLAGFAMVWSELFRAEQARVVQLLVERVDVEEDALEVRIRADGLVSLVGSCDRAGRGKQHDGAR